ncbi:MAG: hypothetical protein ACREBG_08655 [Pyrinomonadaceae bacterium]
MKTSNYGADLRIQLLLLAGALAVLAIHAWHYMPFIADDALISLRYSKRLIEGQGLAWNPGERVEGYSNLLWVLCTAALGLMRIDLIVAVRILGFLGMGATLAATVYAHPLKTWRAVLSLFFVLLFLSLSAPFAVWTIGGMEQPMVAGLLAWAVVFCYPRLERSHESATTMLLLGLIFGLLCLTRLDGVIFTAAAVFAILIIGRASREAWGKAVSLAIFPILFLLGQIVFRRVYYGEWIPNTALVKFNPSGKHGMDGLAYLRAGVFPILPLIALAGLSVVLSFWKKFRMERMVLLCMLAVAWTAYVVLIGGDIFPAWRHLVPLIVLLVLMLAAGSEWVAERASRQAFALMSTACAVLLCVFFVLQSRDEENFRAISERWEWDGKAVGTMLKRAFGAQQPLMAVDPAGCLPYWSELPTVDMLGLNDYYLPRHPPTDLGQGAIGHELGDGQYVLNRRPDLVVFLLPTGNDRGYFLSGRKMQEDPRFFREYVLVRFETPEPHRVISRIWVRKHSERIGIRGFDNRITVPAFLFNENPATVARLGLSGNLIVPISRDVPAQLKLELPAGQWRIEAKGSQPSLRTRVFLPGDTGRMLLDAKIPALLDWKGSPATVNLDVVPDSDGIVELSELMLTRLQD